MNRKWEYLVLGVGTLDADMMNVWGADRWELVMVVTGADLTQLVFKREVR